MKTVIFLGVAGIGLAVTIFTCAFAALLMIDAGWPPTARMFVGIFLGVVIGIGAYASYRTLVNKMP
jgi:hypothetical protein